MGNVLPVAFLLQSFVGWLFSLWHQVHLFFHPVLAKIDYIFYKKRKIFLFLYPS